MAKIVSKSRKKPDIVVTPSNISKTASLVNEVFNDFFITDHTPDSISLNGNLFTLILSNKKFVFQEIKLDKDKDYIDIYLQGTVLEPATYNVSDNGTNIVIEFVESITAEPGEIVASDFKVRGKIESR